MVTRLLIACLCCLLLAGDGECWEVLTSGGAADPCAGMLVCEDFPGVTAPAGWTVTGTVTFDDALLISTASSSAKTDFSATSTVYGYFKFRVASATIQTTFVYLWNGATAPFKVILLADGSLRLYNGTAYEASSPGIISENTDYYVWYYYTYGVSRLWVSTSPAKPVSPALEEVGGNGSLPASAISYNNTSTTDGLGMQVNTVRVSPTDIN